MWLVVGNSALCRISALPVTRDVNLQVRSARPSQITTGLSYLIPLHEFVAILEILLCEYS